MFLWGWTSHPATHVVITTQRLVRKWSKNEAPFQRTLFKYFLGFSIPLIFNNSSHKSKKNKIRVATFHQSCTCFSKGFSLMWSFLFCFSVPRQKTPFSNTVQLPGTSLSYFQLWSSFLPFYLIKKNLLKIILKSLHRTLSVRKCFVIRNKHRSLLKGLQTTQYTLQLFNDKDQTQNFTWLKKHLSIIVPHGQLSLRNLLCVT